MLYKRALSDKIFENLSNDYILIITGPRQVGKTSLLFYLKDELEGEFPITYVSLEDPFLLRLLNEDPSNLLDIVGASPKRQLVLIDEIQYLSDPSHFLKYHFDFNRKNIKLIVTGSSAFYLDTRFRDSLAGRKRIFFLPPLNFQEVLRFKGIDLDATIDERHFFHYPLKYRSTVCGLLKEIMTYGSYPSVVLESDVNEKKNILLDLVESYCKKDVFEANIRHEDVYFLFLKLLASQVGSVSNFNEIASTLRISRYLVERFSQIALKCFHLCKITPFFKNIRKELTKSPKFYFFDCGLRNALLKDFSPLSSRQDQGQLFENFVFNFLGDIFHYENINFWRSKSKLEIDFIVDKRMAIEVKNSPSLIRFGKYRNFLEKYDMPFYFFIFKREDGGSKTLNNKARLIYFC